MEEWVGLKWHDYVTRQAMGEFPEYAVHLKDEARTLGVMLMCFSDKFKPKSTRE